MAGMMMADSVAVTQGTQAALDVARGVGDYGMMAVTCAFFLILSAAMMITLFKWFKAIITQMMDDHKDGFSSLLDETKGQNKTLRELAEGLNDITEGLRSETQLRIRNLSGFAFDLAVEQVCAVIKRTRVENHIADKEATARKLRKSLTVLHDDRDSKLDAFTFKGKQLSENCSKDWVEQVAQVAESELYHADGENESRTRTSVKLAYDTIKTEFYNNMNKI